MPDMFISNSYKNRLNNQAFGQSSAPEGYVLDLFTNNVTVSDTTIAANLTPGAWSGYVQVAISLASLVSATLTGNVSYITTSVVPQFTNTSGGSVNVYGWMLRGATSGLLVAAQNFTGAPVAIANGATATLYPFQIALESF